MCQITSVDLILLVYQLVKDTKIRCPWEKVHIIKNITLNPLHPNISMHILHAVLHTFPDVLTRRICLTLKSFFSWWSFPLTFDVFTCNRMTKLKIASRKGVNSTVTIRWLIWKLEHLVNTPWLGILTFAVCWGAQCPRRNFPHDLFSHMRWDNFRKM